MSDRHELIDRQDLLRELDLLYMEYATDDNNKAMLEAVANAVKDADTIMFCREVSGHGRQD